MKGFIKEFRVAVIIALLALVMIVITACNRSPIDTAYSYDYAWIELPGGNIIEGKVSSWIDFDDGDQIQVTIDGKTYLTDTTRAVLVTK